MNISSHQLACTTPEIRREIAMSTASVANLARRYHITEMTVRKWRERTEFHNRSQLAHRLQTTTLTTAQKGMVVSLRKIRWLPLDDLLAVTREFLCPEVSRSGLARCLCRQGVGRLKDWQPCIEKPKHKPFKAYVPGYLHVDIKYLPPMGDESKRRYLFVAIDRATRWIYIAIKPNKTAGATRAFLKELHEACPINITRLNGKEFTDRLFGSKGRLPTGRHDFDQRCKALGIEHRLTRPRTPQANGMVERFNGRISDILRTPHFHSSEELERTLHRYVTLYNHDLPQSSLGSGTLIFAMKQWFKTNPELFHRRPYNYAGCDS